MNTSDFMYQLGRYLKQFPQKNSLFPKKVFKNLPVSEYYGDKVLLIDISQSMHIVDSKSSRLDVAIKVVQSFTARLFCDEPQAKMATILFGKTALILNNFVHPKLIYLQPLGEYVYGTCVMPGTNITAGLEKVFNMINRNRNDAHVLLLSDGRHNVGTGPELIAEQLREYATLECIGIGKEGCVNEELLSSIASSYPDGSKQYISVADFHYSPLSLTDTPF